MSRPSRIGLEDAAVVLSCALATLYLEWSIIFQHGVYQTDALIHEFWMRRFQDGGLFHDPLTTVLVRSGYIPLGVQALYYAFSYLVDPVRLGAVGAVVVAPLAAWLVFRIVREHTDWRPAGWLGAALFLFPWNVQRFNGMHARAFGEPVVLLTLYLLLRRRMGWAALIPPAAVMLYPPAATVSLIMVLVAAGRSLLRDRRSPARRVAVAAGSSAATATRGDRSGAGQRPAQRPDHGVGGASLRRVQWPRADAVLQRVVPRDDERAVLRVQPGHVRMRAAGRVPHCAAGPGQPAPGSSGGLGVGRQLPLHVCRQLPGAVPAVPAEPLRAFDGRLLQHRDRCLLARPPGCSSLAGWGRGRR